MGGWRCGFKVHIINYYSPILCFSPIVAISAFWTASPSSLVFLPCCTWNSFIRRRLVSSNSKRFQSWIGTHHLRSWHLAYSSTTRPSFWNSFIHHRFVSFKCLRPRLPFGISKASHTNPKTTATSFDPSGALSQNSTASYLKNSQGFSLPE